MVSDLYRGIGTRTSFQEIQNIGIGNKHFEEFLFQKYWIQNESKGQVSLSFEYEESYPFSISRYFKDMF